MEQQFATVTRGSSWNWIVDIADSIASSAEKVTFEVLHSAENADGTVLNERVDTFHQPGGKTLRFEVMGVFEFKDGKISAWRDYFDLKEVERQMAG